MDKTQQNFAVMFADVAGSTQLYERLGDTSANQIIGDAITLVSGIINNHHGVIVKTIGDEVMCRFSTADDALRCACEIEDEIDQQPANFGIRLMFRIGIHWGAALLKDDGDIFGDAVNVAARMAGLAKARQIIITEITRDNLTSAPLISQCREIDRIQVKGKSQPVSIIDVMWEPNESTRMSTFSFDNKGADCDRSLKLCYQQNEFCIEQGAPAYTFGRGGQCDQVIDSNLVSRVHAIIENRRGKFVLIDESTNGTYLKIEDKNTVFLRREEMLLQGSGEISFGEDLMKNSGQKVTFSF